MESFSTTVTIDRPVHDVFAFVSAIENVPAWNAAIDVARKSSPGPLDVGATLVQHRRAPEAEERFTVTELTADRRIAVEGTIDRFPARVAYDVRPAGEGTMLTSAVSLDVSGPDRLVGGIAVVKLKDAVTENLGELKRALETSPSPVTNDQGGHA